MNKGLARARALHRQLTGGRSANEPALPGMGRLAVNFARAQARHLAAGSPLASPELKAARLAVCRQGAGLSPEKTTDGHCALYRPSDDRCSHSRCGCYLRDLDDPPAPTETAKPGARPKHGKATLLTERCPLGYWPDPAGFPAAEPEPEPEPEAS